MGSLLSKYMSIIALWKGFKLTLQLVPLFDPSLFVNRTQTAQWLGSWEASWRWWQSREFRVRKLLQHPPRQLLLLIPAQQPRPNLHLQSPWLSSAAPHHTLPFPSPSRGGRGGGGDERRHRSRCLASVCHGSKSDYSLFLRGPFDDSPLREACSRRGFSCWGSSQGAEWMSTTDIHPLSRARWHVGSLWFRFSERGLWQQDGGSWTKPLQWDRQDYCWALYQAAVSKHTQWGAGGWVLHLNVWHYAVGIVTVQCKTYHMKETDANEDTAVDRETKVQLCGTAAAHKCLYSENAWTFSLISTNYNWLCSKHQLWH